MSLEIPKTKYNIWILNDWLIPKATTSQIGVKSFFSLVTFVWKTFLPQLKAWAFEIIVKDPSIVVSAKRTNALSALMSYVNSWKLEKVRHSHYVTKIKKYLCIRVQENSFLTTRYSTSKRRQACPFTHGKTHTSPVSVSFWYRHLLDFFWGNIWAPT